ncbi:MAG: OmpA family protein [Balneolales bacterium]
MVLVQAGCGSSEEIGQEVLQTDTDTDDDGLPDDEELRIGTNPVDPDTDADGLADRAEFELHNTDPLVADTDGDGLTDGDEVLVYDTDPLNPDTDGDGLSDGNEVLKYSTNPLEEDSDNDGLSDYEELFIYGTNPNNPDSDGDEVTDGEEIELGTDPLDPNDPRIPGELNTINFGYDRSSLDNHAARLLSANVQILLDSTFVYHVSVEAFTDHSGEGQYNLRLSQRRANAVVEFYKANGISEDRIYSRGMGEAPRPCAGEDAAGRGCRDNRRVESIPVIPSHIRSDNN